MGGCEAPPEGQCDAQGVLYTCNGDQLNVENCVAAGQSCAWDPVGMRFKCQAPDQPPNDECAGVPPDGLCQGSVLIRCNAGRRQQEDCSQRGLICQRLAQGNVCTAAAPPPQPDPCEGIAPAGNCEGNVAVYCIDGQRVEIDCGLLGLPCFAIPGLGAICVSGA